MTDGLLRLNNEYLLQQGLELTEDNRANYGVDTNCATLIYEDDACWLYLYKDGAKIIDVVYKDLDKRMECYEI